MKKDSWISGRVQSLRGRNQGKRSRGNYSAEARHAVRYAQCGNRVEKFAVLERVARVWHPNWQAVRDGLINDSGQGPEVVGLLVSVLPLGAREEETHRTPHRTPPESQRRIGACDE